MYNYESMHVDLQIAFLKSVLIIAILLRSSFGRLLDKEIQTSPMIRS